MEGVELVHKEKSAGDGLTDGLGLGEVLLNEMKVGRTSNSVSSMT